MLIALLIKIIIIVVVIIIIRLIGLKKQVRHVNFFKHAEHVGLRGNKKVDGLFLETAQAWHEWARALAVSGPYKKVSHEMVKVRGLVHWP